MDNLNFNSLGFWSNFKNRQNLIIAHRGYSAKYPENTLLAFREAIGKCDFFELDVAFSKDGIPIIMHDDTLERTTNAKELPNFKPPYNIHDYTLQELKSLDASSWFSKELPKQSIPTLKEALVLAKKYNTPLNIEIKDLTNTPFDKVATKKVLELVEELNMQDMVLISSFKHEYLLQSKELNLNISTAAIQESYHPKNIIEYLKNLKVSSYNINIEIFNSNLTKELKNIGISTAVFTINSINIKNKIFKQGADAIFTDEL